MNLENEGSDDVEKRSDRRVLKENDTSEKLAESLEKSGKSHRRYKKYTSMEKALAFLIDGHLYLGDGTSWNDKEDRGLMLSKEAYATCLSYSTEENIAMWMLYGDEKGKKGAMIDFLPSVMKSVLNSQTIEIGRFSENGKFDSCRKLSAEENDFKIFLTDVVYIQEKQNKKIFITHGDEHVTADIEKIDNRDIFYKSYPWSYEKECRLVVRLSPLLHQECKRKGLTTVRLTVPPKGLRAMRNQVIRSPIYAGGTEYGEVSKLTQLVEWDL